MTPVLVTIWAKKYPRLRVACENLAQLMFFKEKIFRQPLDLLPKRRGLARNVAGAI